MARNPTNSYEWMVSATLADYPEFHVDPDELYELIRQNGVLCEYRPATKCPCARIETKMPRINCPHCGGRGFVYRVEDRVEDLPCLVQSRDPARNMKPSGELLSGSARVTIGRRDGPNCDCAPIVIPCQGDLLFPDGETHTVTELITRARNQIDPQRGPLSKLFPDGAAPAPAMPVEDRIKYPELLVVENCCWVQTNEAGRVGNLVFGTDGFDFRIVDDRVVWLEGRGPGAGETYSIRYRARACYALRPGEPVYRSDGDRAFPYRVEARRLDLWGSSDLGT